MFRIRSYQAIRSKPNSCGITLIELLVVMGVIGLIVGLGAPAMSTYTSSIKLKATTRKTVRLLSFARSMAISAHEDHSVTVDLDSKEIYVVNLVTGDTLEKKIHLPSSVHVDFSVGGQPGQDLQLIFRSTGSLIGRTTTITLSSQSKTMGIIVTGVTGAISVQ